MALECTQALAWTVDCNSPSLAPVPMKVCVAVMVGRMTVLCLESNTTVAMVNSKFK